MSRPGRRRAALWASSDTVRAGLGWPKALLIGLAVEVVLIGVVLGIRWGAPSDKPAEDTAIKVSVVSEVIKDAPPPPPPPPLPPPKTKLPPPSPSRLPPQMPQAPKAAQPLPEPEQTPIPLAPPAPAPETASPAGPTLPEKPGPEAMENPGGSGGVRKAGSYQCATKVAPVYPPKASKEGVTGEVLARLRIGQDGQVQEVSILSAKPSGYFERAVKEAARQWVCEKSAEPYLIDVPFGFTLH